MAEKLYDTSVLIDLVKTGQQVTGFTSILNIIEFPKALELKGVQVLYPIVEDYDQALRLAARLLTRGTPLPAIDILLAAMCIRRKARLVTKDEHFIDIKAASKGFDLELRRSSTFSKL